MAQGVPQSIQTAVTVRFNNVNRNIGPIMHGRFKNRFNISISHSPGVLLRIDIIKPSLVCNKLVWSMCEMLDRDHI